MRLQCPKCDANVHASKDDDILRCPKCGVRFRAPEPDDDDEDDDSPRSSRKSKKRQKDAERKFPLVPVVAGSMFLVVAIGVVVAIALTPSKPKNDTTVSTPPPDTKQPPPQFGRPPGMAETPPEVAELFKADIEKTSAPMARVPILQRPNPAEESKLSLSVSRVDRTTGGGTLPPDEGKLSVAEVKKATVYIKCEGQGIGSTGSGFLVRVEKGKGLIATNHHVISLALPAKESGNKAGRVTVVFDSGMKTEAEYPAEILAWDATADLAILRISAPNYPKPIDPRRAPVPTETLAVRICGFPLGEGLSSSHRSPEITIAQGAVSSIRRDDSGNVANVQIDGSLIPGNSGGPIVDHDGRLVGVSVAYVRAAAQIGLAVPAGELIALLDGRILYPTFLPVEAKGSDAVFRVLVPVMDPLKQLKSVTVHVWAGEGNPPAATKDTATGWKLLPNTRNVEMPPAFRGMALAELRVPMPDTARKVAVQTAITTASGTIVSPPVQYELKMGSAQTASDAMPLSTFASNPGRYAGQVISVRAILAGLPPTARWNNPELVIYDESDADATNLVFLTTPDISMVLQELRPPGTDLPVRLTIRVGKAGADGLTPLRVTRVDVIGRGDKLIISIPPSDPPDDQLVAINKNPSKFDGQTVTVDASLLGQTFGSSERPQLSVKSRAGTTMSKLQFNATPELAERFGNAGLDSSAWYRVRLSASVKVFESSNGTQAILTVSKIEIVDPNGKLLRKIE